MRTIIVGDIHGCYHEFKQLLKRVNYKRKQDKLILLGDLMDRGPLSYEVMQWVIEWKKENPDMFFLVRGNHEQMNVEQSGDIDTRLIWRVVGKGNTIKSFRRHKDRMELYIPWILENMPLYYEDEQIRCVHAAVEYEDFEKNEMELLVKDHSYSKKNLYGGKMTIIGHTPLEEPTYYDGSGSEGEKLSYHEKRPLPECGTICIDTGCVFGNKLTALILEDGMYELEYENSRKVYTPNNAHFYVTKIRKLCSLPGFRRFSSGANSR